MLEPHEGYGKAEKVRKHEGGGQISVSFHFPAYHGNLFLGNEISAVEDACIPVCTQQHNRALGAVCCCWCASA